MMSIQLFTGNRVLICLAVSNRKVPSVRIRHHGHEYLDTRVIFSKCLNVTGYPPCTDFIQAHTNAQASLYIIPDDSLMPTKKLAMRSWVGKKRGLSQRHLIIEMALKKLPCLGPKTSQLPTRMMYCPKRQIPVIFEVKPTWV